MQKIIEIEHHLLFFIDFLRVPKCCVRPIEICNTRVVTVQVCTCHVYRITTHVCEHVSSCLTNGAVFHWEFTY